MQVQAMNRHLESNAKSIVMALASNGWKGFKFELCSPLIVFSNDHDSFALDADLVLRDLSTAYFKATPNRFLHTAPLDFRDNRLHPHVVDAND